MPRRPGCCETGAAGFGAATLGYCRRKWGGANERHRQVHARREQPARGLVQPRLRPPRAAATRAPSGHRAAGRPGRSRAALPDGDHPPGGLDRPRDRDPGRSARRLSAVAADSSLSRPPPRAGARYSGAHLLQVRRRLADRLAQAEHGGRAGVLQQAGRRHAAHDRDRRGPVGLGARVCGRDLRPRGRGVHGEDLLRPEAVPPCAHGDIRRSLRREPVRGDQLRPRDPRRASRLFGQPRDRDLGGCRDGRDARRHEVLARVRSQPRAHAPDRHRRGVPGPARARGRPPGCRHRLHRRRIELRRALLSVHRAGAPGEEGPARDRGRAGRVPESDEGALRLRLRRHGPPDAARPHAHARLDLRPATASTPAACATTAWRRW